MKELNQGVFKDLEAPKHPREMKVIRGRIYDSYQRLLKDKYVTEASDVRDIYHALEGEIASISSDFVPNGKEMLRNANRYYKAAKSVRGDLEKFIKNQTDEQLITRFMKMSARPTVTSAKGADAKLLNTINRRVNPNVMDSLATYKLRSMGLEGFGAEGVEQSFNPRSFVTQWKAMSNQGKKILFENRLSRSQYKVLDDAVKYFDEASPQTLNRSGTGGAGIDLTSGVLGFAVNPMLALAPMATGVTLSSQKLATVLNKLPRKVKVSPITRENVDEIVRAYMATGVPQEDVNAVQEHLTSIMSTPNGS